MPGCSSDGRALVNGHRRRIAFAYLFSVYLLCAMAETLVSPLFPLMRTDLDLVEAQQATLLGVVAGGIAVFNIVGGAAATRRPDRSLVRLAAGALAAGLLMSGFASSFPMLLLGQALVGAGFGLFYPSGLASIARIYEARRGRAIANYGLAYSFGLAIAAVAAGVGESAWRWVFYVAGGTAVGLVAWAPRWVEAGPDTATHSLLAQLRTYAAHRDYRISALSTMTGLAMHFVVIGFAPVLFVDRGLELGLVSGLLAAGRLGSVPGKIVCGALFDRFGGLWVTRLIMATEVVLGIPMLVLRASAGVWLLAPFVAVAASVFPIANALLVSALPPRSAWGIGTFRSVMLGSSALLSGLVSVLLLHISLPAVMGAALAVPALAALTIDAVMRRERRDTGAGSKVAATG